MTSFHEVPSLSLIPVGQVEYLKLKTIKQAYFKEWGRMGKGRSVCLWHFRWLLHPANWLSYFGIQINQRKEEKVKVEEEEEPKLPPEARLGS